MNDGYIGIRNQLVKGSLVSSVQANNYPVA